MTAELILGFSSSLSSGLLQAPKNIILVDPQPRIFGQNLAESGQYHCSSRVNAVVAWLARNLDTGLGLESLRSRLDGPSDGKAKAILLAANRDL